MIAVDADNTIHKLTFAAMDKSTGHLGDLVVVSNAGNTTRTFVEMEKSAGNSGNSVVVLGAGNTTHTRTLILLSGEHFEKVRISTSC